MNLRLVAQLLAAWCVLVIAPPILVVALFSGADPEANITGWIFLVWIVGYLLQLGVFMAASRKAKRNAILGWFIASIVPWAADWSAPVSLWWLVPCAAVVLTYSAWFYRTLSRSNNLQQHGVPAVGVVLEVKKPLMNVIINSVYIRRTMRLRIERSDGVPQYEANYSGTFMLGEIPSPGATFNLRVDRSDPRHFETVDDDSAPAAAGWSPQPSAESPRGWDPGDSMVTNQLQRLAEMHHRGDLTDAEFTAAKQRPLNG